jgi:hypothetical protein
MRERPRAGRTALAPRPPPRADFPASGRSTWARETPREFPLIAHRRALLARPLANASALAALLVLPLVGCSGEDPGAPHRTESGVCVDADGDGFGSNCGGGADCDDTNPAVTDDCRCAEPVPGCSCPVQGERVDCGMVEVQVGAQTVCGFGQMVCDQGAWGPCIINNAVPAASAGRLTALLRHCGPRRPRGVRGAAPATRDATPGPTIPRASAIRTQGSKSVRGASRSSAHPTWTLRGARAAAARAYTTSVRPERRSIRAATPQPGPTPGCVSKVCAAKPECCDPRGALGHRLREPHPVHLRHALRRGRWGRVRSATKDTQDHDGDGFSFSQGDCMDCDPDVNPSAYDYPYNGADEDCSGVPDDEVMTCDEALTLSPDPVAQIQSYLSAIELCQTTTTGGPGWGRAPRGELREGQCVAQRWGSPAPSLGVRDPAAVRPEQPPSRGGSTAVDLVGRGA